MFSYMEPMDKDTLAKKVIIFVVGQWNVVFLETKDKEAFEKEEIMRSSITD